MKPFSFFFLVRILSPYSTKYANTREICTKIHSYVKTEMISFQSFLRITKSGKGELQQSQNSAYLNLFLSLISLFFL
jgi:hypothetical protein